MNKIIKHHYPVEKLPEDLRAGLGDTTHVRITVILEDEAEDQALLAALDAKLDKARADIAAGRGMSFDEVRANLTTHAAQWATKTK
jgi:hypothetical protein